MNALGQSRTAGIAAGGEKGILQLLMATHTGMTRDELSRAVNESVAIARGA
jgi:hypothetical protein